MFCHIVPLIQNVNRVVFISLKVHKRQRRLGQHSFLRYSCIVVCPLMKSMIYLQNIWPMKYNMQHTYIYWNITVNSPRQISRCTRLFISKLLPKPLSCLERWKSINYIHLLKQLSWLSLTSLPRHLRIRTLNLFFLVFFSPMLFFFSVSMPIFIINLSQNSFKNMHFRRI